VKVLVIGGAGYIGSHVVKALLNARETVVVFDNLSSGQRDNLPTGATFVYGDILRPDQLLPALAGVDAVIHLAAFKAAGESMIDPAKYSRNNIVGTIEILNGMRQVGVRNIVFSSSAAVYGEPEYLPIDEKHPTVPENYYGFTKLYIEQTMQWYDQLYHTRSASLRYFNAAGYDPEGEVQGLEQNPANLLPVIMEVARGDRQELQIFGDDYPTPDGTGVRDYVHVTDLANAHVAALHYITAKEQSITVNLGSEQGLSVQEIVDTARRVTGREIATRVVPRRPGDPAGLVASSAHAREILKWEPQYSDVHTLVETSWAAYQRSSR
jgi:UDP-glucose 4-epimerase